MPSRGAEETAALSRRRLQFGSLPAHEGEGICVPHPLHPLLTLAPTGSYTVPQPPQRSDTRPVAEEDASSPRVADGEGHLQPRVCDGVCGGV